MPAREYITIFYIIAASQQECSNVMSFLLAQMKELKKTSTPAKPPPIWGGLDQVPTMRHFAALHTKVKSTIKGSILEFIGWRMEYMIEGHIGKCDQEE